MISLAARVSTIHQNLIIVQGLPILQGFPFKTSFIVHSFLGVLTQVARTSSWLFNLLNEAYGGDPSPECVALVCENWLPSQGQYID
jgi:hypothetical protein